MGRIFGCFLRKPDKSYDYITKRTCPHEMVCNQRHKTSHVVVWNTRQHALQIGSSVLGRLTMAGDSSPNILFRGHFVISIAQVILSSKYFLIKHSMTWYREAIIGKLSLVEVFMRLFGLGCCWNGFKCEQLYWTWLWRRCAVGIHLRRQLVKFLKSDIVQSLRSNLNIRSQRSFFDATELLLTRKRNSNMCCN